jgi:hypothetical protein
MLNLLRDRLDRTRRVLRRATGLPFSVRAGIGLAMILAMSVAWPAELVFGRLGVLLYLVALYPAVAPRGNGPTAVIIIAAAGWLLDTTWYDEPVTLWRVVSLAALAYLVHTLAALAAALPYDAIVQIGVLTGWLLRAAGVILIASALIVVTLGLATELTGRQFLAANLVGLGAASAATLLLTRLVRRA